MQPLKTKFTKNGFDFTQIQRRGDIAIFRKVRPEWRPETESYEVIRVQKWDAREQFGKQIPSSEGFPSSEQWGKEGFTTCDFRAALDRAEKMAR